MCFLLSPGASYISGATLKVDAGQSLYHAMWDIPGVCTLTQLDLGLFTIQTELCTLSLLCMCPCPDHKEWPEAPDGENLDALKELLSPQSKL